MDHDSGVFYQETQGQLDCVDGVGYKDDLVRNKINTAPPTGRRNVKPPVYRRSVSAQESSSSRLNDLHETQARDLYKTSFPGTVYNVMPEISMEESEGASNSFDSSYMSSNSDASCSLDSDFTDNRVDTGSFTAPQVPGRVYPHGFRFREENHENRNSRSKTNEVVMGLAGELTGCKQENKRLITEKTVLENKVIGQQNVIKDITKENISLKKNLYDRNAAQPRDSETILAKPMTSHVELQKLLKKTKTFGISHKEKEAIHKELQVSLL